MKTTKLFHTVVVLGMSLAVDAACTSETSPSPGPTADAGKSGTSGSSGTADAAVADASTDAFAGWFCCG
jgi:hypothetical protein